MERVSRHLKLTANLLVWLAAAGLGAQEAPPKTNAPAPPTAAEYKLGPQDKITFSVDEDPIKSGQSDPLTVGAMGDVQIPVSRGYDEKITVQAKGKTISEIQAEIKARLEQDYYKQATVRLRMVDQSRRMGQVLFYGMVRGTVDLFPSEQKTVSAAIIQLGYNEFANLKKVKLHRIDPVTKENKTIIIDVKDILKTNDRKKDIILQDGDRVEVPESGFVF